MYLRNRWYDPQTGRFLTQDPIGLAGGVNLYAYAGNNPISYDDPFGLCPTADGKDDGKPCVITLTIQRQSETTQSTQGTFTLSSTAAGSGTVSGHTLEPPAQPDAQGNGTVRVPAGTYDASVPTHTAVGAVLGLNNVPGRTAIEVHPGNSPRDTRGCILPGTTAGTNTVGNSRSAANSIRDYINRVNASDGGNTIIHVQVSDPHQ